MARIVRDLGEQRGIDARAAVCYEYQCVLDCGCVLAIDRRQLVAGPTTPRDLRAVFEMAGVDHRCNVQQVDLGRYWRPPAPQPMTSQEIRARQAERSRELDAMLMSFYPANPMITPRRTPAQVEAAVRANPPPQQDIARMVRDETIQGLSATLPAQPVGFKPPEKPKEPEKPQPKDRFELIELE